MKKVTKARSAKVVALDPNKGNTTAAIVVASLQKQAKPFIAKLEKIDTVTKENYNQAAEHVKALKNLVELATVEKKKFTDPANAILKHTREFFKPFEDLVASWELTAKLKMSEYLAEEKAKEAKLLKQAEDGKITPATYARKAAELATTTVRGAGGAATVRRFKIAKIHDITKVPREYMVPNMTLIKAALLEGKKVAGCTLEEEDNIAI